MNHLSDPDRIQLVRYLTGESTPEERAEVERWSTDDPEWGHQFERLRRSWEACGPDPVAYDHEALWASLQRMIQADTDSSPRHATRRTVRGMRVLGTQPLRHSVFYGATGIVLGVMAIVLGWHIGAPRLGRHGQPPMLTYMTGNGQRANITLPDGSTVALDVASRLDVPADYLAGNHTLSVMGEALFTIMRHGSVPFTVIAGSVTTRVLGTSFVVRRYATDIATTVAVRDGKVVVGATVLAAGQQAEVEQSGMPHVHMASPAQFTFATGVLTLDDMLLPTAIAELDRWYDADIQLGSAALATHHVKGEFAAGSLADLSAILELTFDVRVVRDGRVLTLYPKT